MDYKQLFEAINIGNCLIKNRYAMAPIGPLGLSDSQGGWSQRGINYYVARARGGVGLIHTGITFVDNDIEKHVVGNCPCSTCNPAHFIRTSQEMTERVHAYGAKIFLQMTGGFGRVSIPKPSGFFPPVAPSPIAHRWKDVTCRELSVDEIHALVKKFGDGAFYAKNAGFDGVQIHAVHEGYLLDQFAISLFNHRIDEYGGSLENRLRIVKEICEEIHDRCGEDFPVTIRYSVKSYIKEPRVGALPDETFTEQGRDIPEGLEAARLLESYGYAALDVDVGSYDAWWWSHPPMYQKKGLYLPFCKMVKDTVKIPVICAGRMDDPNLAVSALRDGFCDMISLGRPLLADEEYVNKLKYHKADTIRPCISCQEGCMGRVGKYSALNCAVNPACARDDMAPLPPAAQKKRVLVIGGGPAGCEAARILALRGHQPVLYEKNDRLGGNLIPGGVPSFKQDDLALAGWYTGELARLKVPVVLGTEATLETAVSERADVAILATGSFPRTHEVRGPKKRICEAADALLGKVDLGKHVIIVGGGTVACETALWCRQNGKSATMVIRGETLLAKNPPLCHANSEMLKNLIVYHDIQVLKSSRLVEISSDGQATIRGQKGDSMIYADNVIMAIGYESYYPLYKDFENAGIEAYVIGDANRVSNIMYAIWDAYEVAKHL